MQSHRLLPNAHHVTAEFEKALADYTGAPCVVAVNSCSMAVFLSLQYWTRLVGGRPLIDCPRYTYVSIPQSIVHCDALIRWTDDKWQARGWYQLGLSPVIDSARWLAADMYQPGTMTCLSFHWTKHLGLSGGGGAILLDDEEALQWLRRARFDGRTPGVPASEDNFQVGWHCYMAPEQAAEGLMRLPALPRYNDPLPEPGYPDLSKQEVFKPHTV